MTFSPDTAYDVIEFLEKIPDLTENWNWSITLDLKAKQKIGVGYWKSIREVYYPYAYSNIAFLNMLQIIDFAIHEEWISPALIESTEGLVCKIHSEDFITSIWITKEGIVRVYNIHGVEIHYPPEMLSQH